MECWHGSVRCRESWKMTENAVYTGGGLVFHTLRVPSSSLPLFSSLSLSCAPCTLDSHAVSVASDITSTEGDVTQLKREVVKIKAKLCLRLVN
jgi:hypothetical protein